MPMRLLQQCWAGTRAVVGTAVLAVVAGAGLLRVAVVVVRVLVVVGVAAPGRRQHHRRSQRRISCGWLVMHGVTSVLLVGGGVLLWLPAVVALLGVQALG